MDGVDGEPAHPSLLLSQSDHVSVRGPGQKGERNTWSGPIVGEHLLTRSLERVDEVLDLVGIEPLRAFGLKAYDLEERVLEDLEAAIGREDDLEPAEDAVGDADEVPVDGGEREDLVCGRNVGLVDLDLQNRIGTLLSKTAADPDLRGCPSPGLGRYSPRGMI
ncbi:hypothetical protein [Methanoculleus horonobensis]|uniref:hypothetical protein n=1 Tax=Methanoculleus horonobensis TaxID=528314 RepID=UPI00082DDDD8|nr:hypothetical protein [Methanoculleus horonobensis]